jgi:hypothetical protein
MKKVLIILASVLYAGGLIAQTSGGAIMGTVKDELTGKPVPFAPVRLITSTQTIGATTNDSGEYSIKGIPPGSYTVEFRSLSHTVRSIHEVKVTSGSISYVNTSLILKELGVVEISYEKWKVGVLEPGVPPTLKRLDAEQISDGANSRLVTDILATLIPRVHQQREGGGLNISGSREGASLYFIDGVKVIGEPQLPNRGIGEIVVITGGIPAQYGDTTSGVVLITTKSY